MEQALLKEKLSQIDECISKKEKDNALALIDDVLEWEPCSSQVYWKKLLAETGCKDDYELLKSGYILLGNPAFENAKKYANDNEKQTYESIEKAKDSINKLLEAELAKKEIEDKSKIGAKEKLADYKKKADDLNKLAQKNINRLEEIEKLIHEYAIDCSVISGEYQYRLENIRSEAQKVGDNYKHEISKEEKDDWEKQLKDIEIKSFLELNKLDQLKSSNPKFLEYSSMVKEQETICEEINQNKADLRMLNSEAKQLANTIDEITKKYTEARADIYKSSYAPLVSLLSQVHFEEIIKESLERRI